MKKKFTFILLIVILLVNFSCSTDNEGVVCNDTGDCIPDDFSIRGELTLTFESLETGGDVFFSEMFNLNEFQIRDANTLEDIEFSFGNFADLNENGIVDEGEFVGNSDQIRIQLLFDPEISDFMYEIVLSENKLITLDFSAVLGEGNDIVEISTISFGDTMFETVFNGSYNVLLDE